jgi:CRISPR-associated protein Csx17
VPNELDSLRVVAFDGLPPVSLGNYLASLGLLRVLTENEWPNLRASWKDGVFQLVGGPRNNNEVLDKLCDIAKRSAWTPYERGWGDKQKESTKKKSGIPLALWQASADESVLELLAAHAVPASKVSFNLLLGSGGNAGKRDFSEGWKRARQALAKDGGRNSPDAAGKRAELAALLQHGRVSWMVEKLNSASWFSETNKLYNSGQNPYRKGAASPWGMVLACEGLRFFAGGASKRLGARARSTGAFPFVTRPAAPQTAGEAGHDIAEVWAPLWSRPMTVAEAVTLFTRGRAEVRGRGVLTPSGFATAVVRRGIDAGITEFRRFVLGRTTSSKTFEPRFEGSVRIRSGSDHRAAPPASVAMERLLSLVERLPRDEKKGKRWRYLGLRGATEAGMVRVAAAPSDPEAARDLADSVVCALDHVDRNRGFRELNISWEPLPLEWLPSLFGDETISAEARLALAAVSAFPAGSPFTLYRFGVESNRGSRFVHADQPPKQWVWKLGQALPRLLCGALQRRLLDWEAAPQKDREKQSLKSRMPASCTHVAMWLDAVVDDDLLERWLSRLALFDWRWIPPSIRSFAQPSGPSPASSTLCLFALFQPLVSLGVVSTLGSENLLPVESGARTPAVARLLLSLLSRGEMVSAVKLAGSRYAMAGARLATTEDTRQDTAVREASCRMWDVLEPERQAASLVFSVLNIERAALIERWLRPKREPGGQDHGK